MFAVLVGSLVSRLVLSENPASGCPTYCTAMCAPDLFHGSAYLQDLCCSQKYTGIPATVLAFEEDDLWAPRLEEFNRCTKAKVAISYTPKGEDGMQAALEEDVGVKYETQDGGSYETEGAGIFDAYVVQVRACVRACVRARERTCTRARARAHGSRMGCARVLRARFVLRKRAGCARAPRVFVLWRARVSPGAMDAGDRGRAGESLTAHCGEQRTARALARHQPHVKAGGRLSNGAAP